MLYHSRYYPRHSPVPLEKQKQTGKAAAKNLDEFMQTWSDDEDEDSSDEETLTLDSGDPSASSDPRDLPANSGGGPDVGASSNPSRALASLGFCSNNKVATGCKFVCGGC